MDYSYKIVTPNDADPKGAVIEKSGLTVQFSVAQMELEQSQLVKIIKELTGKLEVETAKSENIETHHDFVTKMSDEDLFTTHMYWESHALVKQLPEKIAELQAQLDGSIAEQKTIAEQLGIAVNPEDTTPGQDAAKKEAEVAPAAEETAPEVATEPAAPVEEAEQKEEAPADPEPEVTVEPVGTAVELNDESLFPELAGVNIVTAVNTEAKPCYKTDKSGDTWVKAVNFHRSETQPENDGQQG